MDNSQPFIFGRGIDELINKTVLSVYITRIGDLSEKHENINYFHTVLTNVISMRIKDSTDSYFRTATLLLSDRNSFRMIAPLTGNEIISVKYKNHLYSTTESIPHKVIHFRIFDVEEYEDNTEQNSNGGAKFIQLELVEFPAFDLLSYNEVYKTTSKDMVISDYIIDMLNNIPNLKNHYDINVDQCQSDLSMSFYSPNWTAVKNIEYLKRFMIDKKGRGMWSFNVEGSDKDNKRPTMSFNSILSSLDTDSYREYSSMKSDTYYKPPNRADGPDTSIDKSIKSFSDDKNYAPLDYIAEKKIIKWGNASKLMSGYIGKTMANYSFDTGANYNAIDYTSFIKNYKSLGKFSTLPANHKLGNQWSSFGYSPFNNSKLVDAYNKNTFFNSHFRQMCIQIKCPLNQTRSNGETAFLYLPNPMSSGEPFDTMMSGKWLTWDIDDYIFGDGSSYSIITMYRDAFWILNNKDKFLQELSSYEDKRIGRGA